ncbi:MAG: hypothetical protein ABIK64_01080, partial [Bacillota bacterium]
SFLTPGSAPLSMFSIASGISAVQETPFYRGNESFEITRINRARIVSFRPRSRPAQGIDGGGPKTYFINPKK